MANELKHKTVGTAMTQAEFEDVLLHVLDSQATGDIIYASSATQLRRLGIGSTNQKLAVVGGIPAWVNDVKSMWAQFHQAGGAGVTLAGNYNNYGAVITPDAADTGCRLTLAIPTGFNTLTKAVAVVIPEGTGNLKWDCASSYGANGEASATHGTTASGTTAVTNNLIKELDISGALASLAAGDYVGLNFTRYGSDVADTVGAEVNVLGILIEYT